MPIDPCYAITLPSRMCVIPCCFYSGITSLFSLTSYHSDLSNCVSY